MSDSVMINGNLPTRFGRVGDVFNANFEAGAELGASFAVFIDGESVLDIWGGFTDRKRENPWTEETLACVYSSGKAVCAYLVARAVSDGLLDYEAPIASYWPEFAANGKDVISVAQGLSHQAGLCGFPDEMSPADWLDWDLICSRLAAMAPLWMPGTANGYHPQTYGFIAGELIRRVTGRTVGAILREDFFEPGNIGVHCGIDDDAAMDIAPMQKPPRPPDLGELNDMTKIAFLKPWSSPGRGAQRELLAAELPASNMHATARGLAEILQPLARNGEGQTGRKLSLDAVAAALETRIAGSDLVLPFHIEWAAGVMKNANGHYGPNTSAYGQAGFGGSSAVIDPAHRMTIAYVMNKMSPHLVGDPRAVRLINAVYDCL